MDKKLQLVSLLVLLILPMLGLLTGPEQGSTHPDYHLGKSKKIVKNPYYDAFVKRFSDRLDSVFDKHGTPGAAVAIVIDSTTYLLKGYGVKTAGTNNLVNEETQFRLASVSKGFSSILTGLFVEKGLIQWNDPLARYINNFHAKPAIYTDSITISHILSHTAGYPYQAYSTLIEDGLQRDSLFKALENIKLARRPGEIHSYQNVAYDLIEPVLESTTGQSFGALMQENIFDPLGMHQASITYEAMHNSSNRASAHLSNGRRYVPVSISPDYYNVAAAGGINASIKDMSQYMKALLGYREDVIPKEVLDKVFTPQIRTHVKSYGFSRFERHRKGNYGLGWRIVEYPDDTIVYHNGYANGFKSAIALNRTDNISICILTNAPGSFSSNMVVDFFKTFNDYKEDIDKWRIAQDIPEMVAPLKPKLKAFSQISDTTATVENWVF